MRAGLASEVLLEIGRKPVVRELHDAADLAAAAARWHSLGYETAAGDVVREDPESAALVTDARSFHTVRPLASHPVVERAVSLGGALARRVLLSPESRLYRFLCERLGADVEAAAGDRPSAAAARERRALYVSRDPAAAARARDLDRMSADGGASADSDTLELGRLLGYPDCCVRAFAALPRRWPNRIPIEAAAARTHRFEPRLNDLALDRFAWIAWFPCRYDCPASLEIAAAAAAALASRDPDLVREADRLLALPRVYRSDTLQAVLLGAAETGPGRFRFDRLAPLDDVWPAPSGLPSPAGAWDDLAAADAVRLTPDGAVFTSGGRELRTADAPLVLPFGL